MQMRDIWLPVRLPAAIPFVDSHFTEILQERTSRDGEQSGKEMREINNNRAVSLACVVQAITRYLVSV